MAASLFQDSIFSSGKVAAMRGVQMGPGATAFTRMPLDTSCWDRERVKPIWGKEVGGEGGGRKRDESLQEEGSKSLGGVLGA
jgi:hypothetical protein